MVDFGRKIKALRLEQEMTQQQVADRIGVTKSVVSAYETNLRMPSYDVLKRLATLFRVSTDYLLGMEKTATIDITGLSGKDVDIVYALVRHLKAIPRSKE